MYFIRDAAWLLPSESSKTLPKTAAFGLFFLLLEWKYYRAFLKIPALSQGSLGLANQTISPIGTPSRVLEIVQVTLLPREACANYYILYLEIAFLRAEVAVPKVGN
jgi:hypothetical protein